MSRPIARGAASLLVCLLALARPGAAAEGERVHGADAVFRGESVAIAWVVLKDPKGEEQTLVVIRIVNTTRQYHYVSVEGVNPFRGWRQSVVEGLPLNDQVDVRSPRRSFADFPRREIHLYRDQGELKAKRPALTVYYLGVPDTTPEFTSEAGIQGYLELALRGRR